MQAILSLHFGKTEFLERFGIFQSAEGNISTAEIYFGIRKEWLSPDEERNHEIRRV